MFRTKVAQKNETYILYPTKFSAIFAVFEIMKQIRTLVSVISQADRRSRLQAVCTGAPKLDIH
jgi:hypothetical protein